MERKRLLEKKGEPAEGEKIPSFPGSLYHSSNRAIKARARAREREPSSRTSEKKGRTGTDKEKEERGERFDEKRKVDDST